MLFFIVSLIKSLLDYDAREYLLADSDKHLSIKLGILCIHHCEADALVQCDRMVSCGNHTDPGAVLCLDRVCRTRNSLVL